MNNKKRLLPHFSAIIFDMDGLVLDTETTYCTAWQSASAEMGAMFTQEFCLSMSGLHAEEVEQRLLNFCGADFNLAHFYHLSGKYWRNNVYQQGIPVKKGFFELLDSINKKEIPFCLATNSREKNTLECLELANISTVFHHIITRDHVENAKPAPDSFLLAAKTLSQPIVQCLVLEDSTTGIQAALNAGAPSVFIPSTMPVDTETAKSANLVLNDLGELTQFC